jgi:isopenicillin N synthase-like dioxygenase
VKVEKIDFKSPDMATKLLNSLRNTGFAVIENHPITSWTINQLYEDWSKFFASEVKEKYTHKPGQQVGFFPMGSEKAKDRNVFDLKEFYHYYQGGPVPTQAKNSTIALRNELNLLGLRLLSAIYSALPAEIKNGLQEPLNAMAKESPSTLFRILYYPPIPEDSQGAVRSAPHEDINLITLLPAATAAGLQVKDLEGNWWDVDTNPGNIVVNAGDMLKEATGGYIPSTTHQVINPVGADASKPRYSAPLFVHPRGDVRLSVRYTAQEYLIQRLKEIGIL